MKIETELGEVNIKKVINENNKSCCTCLHKQFEYKKHKCNMAQKRLLFPERYINIVCICEMRKETQYVEKICLDCKHTVGLVNRFNYTHHIPKYDHWHKNEIPYWRDYILRIRKKRYDEDR